MIAIFCKESVVCGHHVYKAVWTLFVAEILDARREDENSHDRHAFAVVFDNCVVGHLPQECLRLAWHFLQYGGKTSCKITGRLQSGLDLVYKFQGKEKLVVRRQKVIDKRN